MKNIVTKIFGGAVICVAFMTGGVMAATFTSCGPGYVLVDAGKIDGIPAAKCQKLWCRDMETGRDMGRGDAPNNGYRMTDAPVEICDSKNNCIECWGERRWCGTDTPGVWMSRFGAYTRGGSDNPTYRSYLRGACFSWQLEKPTCPDGETAILTGDEWVCATSTTPSEINRASAVRRTGTIRRIGRKI